MNRNNLKQYLLEGGLVTFEVDEAKFSMTAEWKQFRGECHAEASDFLTVGGRMRTMSGALEFLVDCIIEADQIISQLHNHFSIQNDIENKEKNTTIIIYH